MEHVLLSVHVVASIVLIGGSAVATSLFPKYAPIAVAAGGTPDPERNAAIAAAMHRITGGYAVAGLIVPAMGMALAVMQGRIGEIWITIAVGLTTLAGGLLGLFIHPTQRDALREPDDGSRLRSLSMTAGIYNLLWTAVVVLMIVRPGSNS